MERVSRCANHKIYLCNPVKDIVVFTLQGTIGNTKELLQLILSNDFVFDDLEKKFKLFRSPYCENHYFKMISRSCGVGKYIYILIRFVSNLK